MCTSKWTEKSLSVQNYLLSLIADLLFLIDGSDSESLDIESDDDDCFV